MFAIKINFILNKRSSGMKKSAIFVHMHISGFYNDDITLAIYCHIIESIEFYMGNW